MAEVNVGAGPSGVSIQAAITLTVDLAGNGHSTNGSSGSTTPARSHKRPRRPEQWKKNVAKFKRARGEKYVSPSSGKTVPARILGQPCNCKKKCFELFTQEASRCPPVWFNQIQTCSETKTKAGCREGKSTESLI